MNRSYTKEQLLLSIADVNLTLGEGKNRHLILRDVEAEIRNIVRPDMHQGQVIGLLGPSGIGKTQLFKIIAGFQEPDCGTVLVGAEQTPPTRGKVGVVTQHYRVFPHLSVLGNLVFAGKQGGLTTAEATDKANHYLEQFDLIERRNLWPASLSGGQRQRVAILQQVMVGHEFICMDEPFSGLDVNQVRNVAELISRLTSEDELLTIIVVTHDIGAAIETADTLWMMGKDRGENGELIEGARIVAQSDLIEEGLAWDPAIRQNPRFLELESLVAERFRTLAQR